MYVCDTDSRRRQTATHTWRSVTALSNPDELILKDDIDAVIVSSPAITHYPLVQKALLAGKDVFVEKPFTLAVSEAEELAALAKAQNRILMVGHLLEYHPVVNYVRDMIRSGELGDIYYIYSQRVNLGRIRGDENALWSFAPHDISQILYLLDMEPQSVSTRGQSYIQSGIEDVVFLTVRFPKKVMAHIHISWLDPHKVRSLTIVGSKKMVVFEETRSSGKLLLYDKQISRVGNGFQATQSRPTELPYPADEPLRVECQHFVDCVATGAKPCTPAEDGVRVLEVLEACQRSLQLNGELVQITKTAFQTLVAM
jgi:predicted dehydrogenase